MKSKKTSKNIKKSKNIPFYKSFIENIASLNTSKFFTGVIMLTLNVSSKYITMGLSTSQEQYLRYTLGRQVLVFAILWMGTRDIIVALILTCVFMLFADYLFNDNSMYCIIPTKYREKINDTENKEINQKDINDAIHLLKKARIQKEKKNNKSDLKDIHIYKGLYKENFI